MADPPPQPDEPQEEDLEDRVRQRLGSEIAGVGTLEEVVGIGGMATVYRAETPEGSSVAVKLMHEHLADKGSLRRRFIREAKILDQVDHPNSIKVFDRGSAQTGEAFFVMELLDGWEVETVWKNKDREFPVPEALEIGEQALACLHAYHRADVLHRDLKPSNLFLTRQGLVKLIDFGVARFRDQESERTRSGTALGTPAYMAPEQAMGKVEILDARTDVYGLGAVLFTLLSGRRVHEADSNDETLVMAATQPADSLARHASDVPTEVVQVVDRALAWDPDDRYESAEAMRAEIEKLLEDEAALERAEGEPEADVEDEQEALEREAADVRVDLDDASLEGMQVMFERLERALNAGRIYEWDHDKTVQSMDHAYEAFRETIDREHGEVVWQVRPHSFEIGAEVLWEPEDPFETVPYNLFLDGFRRIQLRTSMLQEEFEEFARWLILEPARDLPPEDDLATALWDLELDSVDGKVVTAPSMIDPDRDDLLLEEAAGDLMERAQSMMQDGAGKRLLVAMRTGAYAEAEAMATDAESGDFGGGLGRDFTTADRGLVDASRLDQLSKALQRTSQNWQRRIERILADIWGDTVDPDGEPKFLEAMQDWIDLYLESDRLEPLLRSLLRAHRRLETEAERRLMVDHLLDETRLETLTDAVRRGLDSGEDRERGANDELLELYGQLLEIVPGGRFSVLLEAFDTGHPAMARALARYLNRHSGGREPMLARRLHELEPEGAKLLMRVIANAGTEEAFEILARELESTDPEMRRRAIDLIDDNFELDRESFELSKPLTQLIEDPDEQLRFAALRLAREVGGGRLVPAVAGRAQASDFDGLSTDERREILRTLAVLSRSKAQEVACELAEHHGVMPSDDRQQTRVLALRILGEIGNNERALEAAESGKGGWWWNSDEVKEAAETAYEQIERRLHASA